MLWRFRWLSLWTQLLLGSISHPSLPLDIHVWDQHTCTFFCCWLGQGSLQQALSVLSPHISSLRWNEWWHLVVLQWPQWLVETLQDSYLHPMQFPNPHNAEFSRFSQYSATWHCHTLYLHLSWRLCLISGILPHHLLSMPLHGKMPVQCGEQFSATPCHVSSCIFLPSKSTDNYWRCGSLYSCCNHTEGTDLVSVYSRFSGLQGKVEYLVLIWGRISATLVTRHSTTCFIWCLTALLSPILTISLALPCCKGWQASGPQWLLWLALLRPFYVLSCSSFASSSFLLQN